VRGFYAFLGGGGLNFCLHFSTTFMHISDVGSRGSETENLMSSERATEKPSREGKQNKIKFMQWKLRKTSYFKKNRMPRR
jgi:hypothetical protein